MFRKTVFSVCGTFPGVGPPIPHLLPFSHNLHFLLLYPSLIISVWLASLKAPIPHFIPYLSITLPSLMCNPFFYDPPSTVNTLTLHLSLPLIPSSTTHTCTLYMHLSLLLSLTPPPPPLPSLTHHPPLPPLPPQPSHRA